MPWAPFLLLGVERARPHGGAARRCRQPRDPAGTLDPAAAGAADGVGRQAAPLRAAADAAARPAAGARYRRTDPGPPRPRRRPLPPAAGSPAAGHDRRRRADPGAGRRAGVAGAAALRRRAAVADGRGGGHRRGRRRRGGRHGAVAALARCALGPDLGGGGDDAGADRRHPRRGPRRNGGPGGARGRGRAAGRRAGRRRRRLRAQPGLLHRGAPDRPLSTTRSSTPSSARTAGRWRSCRSSRSSASKRRGRPPRCDSASSATSTKAACACARCCGPTRPGTCSACCWWRRAPERGLDAVRFGGSEEPPYARHPTGDPRSTDRSPDHEIDRSTDRSIDHQITRSRDLAISLVEASEVVRCRFPHLAGVEDAVRIERLLDPRHQRQFHRAQLRARGRRPWRSRCRVPR